MFLFAILLHPSSITWDTLLLHDWNSDSELFKYDSQCTYLDVINSNGPLLRFFVNWSTLFYFKWSKWFFTVLSSTYSRMKWWFTSMWFVHWNSNALSNTNISPTISTCTEMRYSTTPIYNKIAQKNSIVQHTSIIAEYLAFVTDNVTF